MYLTIFRCESSSLNGEELVRDGGIPLLAALLSRCMFVVQPTTPATEPSAIIVANIMRTFSVLSQFESARIEMLELSGLVEDIVHCTELELVPAAIDSALQTIAHVSVSSEFQNTLVKSGVLWYVRLLLNYSVCNCASTNTLYKVLTLGSFWDTRVLDYGCLFSCSKFLLFDWSFGFSSTPLQCNMFCVCVLLYVVIFLNLWPS